MAHFLSCLSLRFNNFKVDDIYKEYVTSFYFIWTTASTIGYGDESVDLKETRSYNGRVLFAIAIMIASLIFFAYVQSLITNVREQWTLVENKVNEEVQSFEDWMAVRNQTHGVAISFKFDKKLKDYFDYMHNFDLFSTVNQHGFIDLISEALREEVMLFTSHYVREAFTFFEGMPEVLAKEIVFRFTPMSFIDGDRIIKRKEESKGVYLVLKGKVLATYKNPSTVIEAVEEKEYFGDFCFLRSFSHFDYTANGSVVCLFAEEKKIMEILMGNKREMDDVIKTAKLRMKYMVYLKKLVLQSKLVVNSGPILGQKSQKMMEEYLDTEQKQLFDEDDDQVKKEDNQVRIKHNSVFPITGNKIQQSKVSLVIT